MRPSGRLGTRYRTFRNAEVFTHRFSLHRQVPGDWEDDVVTAVPCRFQTRASEQMVTFVMTQGTDSFAPDTIRMSADVDIRDGDVLERTANADGSTADPYIGQFWRVLGEPDTLDLFGINEKVVRAEPLGEADPRREE